MNKVQRVIEYIREQAHRWESTAIDDRLMAEIVLGLEISPSTVYKAINRMIEAGEIEGKKGKRVYVGRWIKGAEMAAALDTTGGIPRIVNDEWRRETALKLGTTLPKLQHCLYAAESYYRTIELSNCTYGLSYRLRRAS